MSRKRYVDWMSGTALPEGAGVISETRGRLDPYAGTLDLELFPIMGLGLSERASPSTLNWAYDQGVKVTIRPHKCDGKVMIRNLTIGAEEILDIKRGSFRHGVHALAIAAAYFTKIVDIDIEVRSKLPSRSGLGLSGALASALLLALCKVRELIAHCRMPSLKETVVIAHYLEHTAGISLTGYQDQAASIFGGVAFYTWYHPSVRFMLGEEVDWFNREELMNGREIDHLNGLVSTYYSGASHSSSVINEYQLRSMIDGVDRDMWFREAEIAIEARDATKGHDYDKLVRLLNESYEARRGILPSFYTNEFQEAVIKVARKHGGGAKLAGAGAGGGVFTLSSSRGQAKRIAEDCMRIVKNTPGASMLHARISNQPGYVKTI
jgi:galactokinase/mevalonate kinase-like predicted kinase